jgi:hypothetical protein
MGGLSSALVEATIFKDGFCGVFQRGVRLEPEQLIDAARGAGRTPAQRTTLYDIVETY